MQKHRVDKPHNLYHISIPPKLVLGSFDNMNFKKISSRTDVTIIN